MARSQREAIQRNALRDAEALQKEEQVLSLRRAGATYGAIAQQLGYANRSSAHAAYARALAREIAPNIREVRELEAARLEQLQLGIWGKAMAGDVRAAEVVVKIMERRAKLFGLDAPITHVVEVITEDMLDRAIQQLEAELGAIADRSTAGEIAETSAIALEAGPPQTATGD